MKVSIILLVHGVKKPIMRACINEIVGMRDDTEGEFILLMIKEIFLIKIFILSLLECFFIGVLVDVIVEHIVQI